MRRGADCGDRRRPMIADSWRRVELSGLRESVSLDSGEVGDVDRRSRLMIAAAPVLDEMTRELADTKFAIMLADRRQRITDLRCQPGQVRRLVELSGGIEGIRFSEDVTGTNSIATAFELRGAVAVRGDEHYVESLRSFACYGHPIFDPVTRRVEGVLDISGLNQDDTPLLAPYVGRVARQISERLLLQSRSTQIQILQCFHMAGARSRTSPVVAVGHDIFLANSAAMQVLETADEAVFRAATPDAPGGIQHLRLTSGRSVTVTARPVQGVNGAAVFTFSVDAEVPAADASRQLRSSTVISGERGTGRTAYARELAGRTAHWLDAAGAGGVDEARWLRRAQDVLADPHAVVLEQIELLSPGAVAHIADLLRGSPAPVVLTASTSVDTPPHVTELMARCDDQVMLQPLRHRRAEIPRLVTSILGEAGAARELRFTPGALGALAAYDWPGNLHELRAVVHHIADTRRVGDVTVADLPQILRNQPRRALLPIEQAERDAVVAALHASGGNKKLAARTLGISRTTLYRALRTYGITDAVAP